MDWIYAAPHDVNGGRYLRLIIQAKRAQYAKLKSGGYWYYHHLDHGKPPGKQARTLVKHAASSPDGMKTHPLYMFYHPESALAPAIGKRPAIEGINYVPAVKVRNVVKNGCIRNEKRVGYWRNDFGALSDLLCWPALITRSPGGGGGSLFFLQSGFSAGLALSGTFHPDLVAARLSRAVEARRDRRGRKSEEGSKAFRQASEDADGMEIPKFEAADGIPSHVLRALAGEQTEKDRQKLKRPRVIFSTPIVRETSLFSRLAEDLNEQDQGQ